MNELVKAQLETVGFQVKFEVLDWNTVIDAYIRGWQKYPTLDGLNFSSGVVDPLSGLIKTYATIYRSPVGPNWGWYENKEVDDLVEKTLSTFENKEVDDLVEKTLSTFDENEQNRLLSRINEITTKDAARVFIVSDLNPRALSPKLKGFVQVQSWFQDLTPIVVGEK
jgi:peptide/nickel transport system substrate-binding protein